jgi:hypothetical protein
MTYEPEGKLEEFSTKRLMLNINNNVSPSPHNKGNYLLDF